MVSGFLISDVQCGSSQDLMFFKNDLTFLPHRPDVSEY
jgi:hypothetical protein